MISARLTQYPLTSAANTAAHMVNLATKYASDLGDKAKWPLPKFYRYVRSLEFRSDPAGHESIARPALTMGMDWPWRDCDDKAILLGAWCYANKIPFRFRASSKAPSGQLHHVYVMAKIKGRLVPLDATYPRNQLGIEERGLTAKHDLTGDIMNTLNVFEGDMYRTNINPELMGSSFVTKLGKVAKKTAKVTVKAAKVAAAPTRAITHAVLRTPGLKDAIASAIPGGSAALASLRAAAKAGKGATQYSMTETQPTGLEMPVDAMQPQGMSTKKKIGIALGVALVVGAAVVATKKKRS